MKYRFRTAAGRAAPLVAAALAAALLVSSCTEIDLLKALRARMADADYIYVSPDGSDDNTGISPDSPFATIQRGLAVAEAADAYEVRVAEGEYVVDNERDIIEVPEDVALKGGWSPDFTAWAPRTYVTTIAQGEGRPSALVSCSVGSNPWGDCFERAIVDGFSIVSTGVTAVYAERELALRNCIVTARQTEEYTGAVHLNLHGDSCSSWHFDIANNVIRAEGGPCVSVTKGCGVGIAFNTMIATGNRGIHFDNPDEGGQESGIVIASNIIGGPGSSGTGVANEHVLADWLTSSYEGNLLYGFASAFDGEVTDGGGNSFYEAVDVSGDLFAGGLDGDLSDGDDTDYHLVDEGGTTYAVDLGVWNNWGGPAFDFEGDPRPYPEGSDGYDRGADEKVP